jgi:hypothetical protein
MRQRADPRPDLEDGLIALQFRRGHHSLQGGRLEEEVLSQALVRADAVLAQEAAVIGRALGCRDSVRWIQTHGKIQTILLAGGIGVRK